jgi:hypothetical protein
MALLQANSGTATIFVDEFDTSAFEGSANGNVIRCCHGRFGIGRLGAPDSR